jgi:hypothetical protein
VDEGIIEGGEDTGDTKHIFAFCRVSMRIAEVYRENCEEFSGCGLTFSNLRTERDVLGRGAFDLLLGRHLGV